MIDSQGITLFSTLQPWKSWSLGQPSDNDGTCCVSPARIWGRPEHAKGTRKGRGWEKQVGMSSAKERQEGGKSRPVVTLLFRTKGEVDQRSELRSNVGKRVETETGTLGPGAIPTVSKSFPSLPAYTLWHKSLLPWGGLPCHRSINMVTITRLVFKLGILSSNIFQLDANSVTSHNNKCSHSVFGT